MARCRTTPTTSKYPLRDLARFDQVVVEIQFGEGGQDSKLFVDDLFDAYRRYAAARGLAFEPVCLEDGHAIAIVCGRGASHAFRHEPGRHVVQRIPPTERSGRRQTSVVSVIVMPVRPAHESKPLRECDLEVKTQTGKQKAGGQNVNKVASAVRMRHIPTGMSVMINGRDQHQNRQTALRILTAKVHEAESESRRLRDEFARRQQLQSGSKIGGRGEKIRTYNLFESRIVDYRLGAVTRDVKSFMKGRFEVLFGN